MICMSLVWATVSLLEPEVVNPEGLELEVHATKEALELFDVLPSLIQRKVSERFSEIEWDPLSPVARLQINIERSTLPNVPFRGDISASDYPDIKAAFVECQCDITEFSDAMVSEAIQVVQQIEKAERLKAQEESTASIDSPLSTKPPPLESEIHVQANDANSSKRAFGAMIGVGSALAVTGAALVISGGIVLARAPNQEDKWSVDASQQLVYDDIEQIRQQRVGAGLTAGGVVSLGAGIALIVIGAKRRRRTKKSSVTVVPSLRSISFSGAF